MVSLGNGWDAYLAPEFEKPYYKQLRMFLKSEYLRSDIRVFPDMYDIFNALRYTDYNDVKAVIIGQDPYHGFGQAHGLCFSVKKGVPPPPSLVNIFKELHDDLGLPIPTHGELTQWARQGVLMLNSVLTVREGQAGSHRGKGWETFTDEVIRLLGQRDKRIVFILWGNYAKEKRRLITNPNHVVIQSAHPSPLSAYNGFFGSKPFSRCNAALDEPIDWRIE